MKNIYISTIILMLLFLISGTKSTAQQFWLTTNEFWGGPKTGIIRLNDSMMFVSTTNSVMRTTNQFQKLDKVLDASAIYSLFSTKQGKVLAGGIGKVFISDDLGMSWDSIWLNTTFPIKQIIENSYGELMAITGIYEDGDGVFFSGDGGKSWDKRNNGLSSYLGCDKIAIDKNDRMYLAMSDPDKLGFGGLFISENSGLQWKKVAINIDSIGNNVRIGITTNLTILPNDSVYLSFHGSGGNHALQLNIYKSINDILASSNWSWMLLMKSNSNWGMDKLLNNIHRAQNGNWYSSVDGHINNSGTCFSKEGNNWEILEYGLGLDKFGWHSEQFFVETENGKIYMIQMLDERIYKTDTSILTSAPLPVEKKAQIRVYPNPVLRGEKVRIELNDMTGDKNISIYDLTGKILHHTVTQKSFIELTGLQKEGIYIVSVRNKGTVNTSKIVIQ
ncbi:T9SS type A sorting domain-containing protein [Maribellus sediminis]|uniref:T9SS type A sorting domain-containing protein n=1 Tax=Maribellus sediminis TaxID=2696285 RepID=UPI001431970A|nr:T9SS type A sorting domain-containing protein [Maribellus sediminis]